jgi:hypothetical protein
MHLLHNCCASESQTMHFNNDLDMFGFSPPIEENFFLACRPCNRSRFTSIVLTTNSRRSKKPTVFPRANRTRMEVANAIAKSPSVGSRLCDLVDDARPHLVLDLDETLIHSVQTLGFAPFSVFEFDAPIRLPSPRRVRARPASFPAEHGFVSSMHERDRTVRSSYVRYGPDKGSFLFHAT